MNHDTATKENLRTKNDYKQKKNNENMNFTGRSIKTPIGTTEAKSVRVRRRACFSFSVNSSPTSALLSNPMAAATSIARS